VINNYLKHNDNSFFSFLSFLFLSLVSCHQNLSFFSFIHQRGVIHFLTQNHPSNLFLSLPFIERSDFHVYFVFYFVILSSSCNVGLFVVFVRHCLFYLFFFPQVFDRFRLSDQFRSSADQINDFGVIHVTDLETWLFQRFKYSHMCSHLYFVVLCY